MFNGEPDRSAEPPMLEADYVRIDDRSTSQPRRLSLDAPHEATQIESLIGAGS
jgi:hypothetical protein